MRTARTADLMRSEVLSFRVSPIERAVFFRMAEQERRGPSETLREILRAEAERRGLWPPADSLPAQAGSMMLEAR